MATTVLLAACSNREQPRIISMSPSTVDVAQLPLEATVVGRSLEPSVRFSLNDRRAAAVQPVRAWLAGLEVSVAPQLGPTELRLTLPAALAEGVYDLDLELGPGRSLHYMRALTVQDPSFSGPSSSASPSSEAASPDNAVDAGLVTAVMGTSSSVAVSDSTLSVGGGTSDAIPSQKVDAGSVGSPLPKGDASLAGLPDAQAIVLDPPDAGLASADAGLDAANFDATLPGPTSPRCAPGEFGAPEPVTLGGVGPGVVWAPSLSADHQMLYFAVVSGGATKEALWVAQRSDRSAVFTQARLLGKLVVGGGNEGTPFLSHDGLSLYVYADGTTGVGDRDLYVAHRASVAENFGGTLNLVSVNSPVRDHLPWVSRDELQLIFLSSRGSSDDFWRATRASRLEPFSAPVLLGSLNSPNVEGRITLTADELTAYFSSQRPGGRGADDIWFATRSSVNEEFANVQNLAIVNTMRSESDVALSSDAEELFFVTYGSGTSSMYRAQANCSN